MMDMKKYMMIMVLGALMAYLVPAQAQRNQDQWQTSTMQTSGSAYSSQVTAVGATAVPSEATTTDANYAPGRPGQPRRSIDTNNEWEDDGDQGSPIGDAVLPLMLMAMAYAVYSVARVYKRKRRA